MNQLTRKLGQYFSLFILSVTACAAHAVTETYRTEIVNAKLGCMACHQSEFMQPVEENTNQQKDISPLKNKTNDVLSDD